MEKMNKAQRSAPMIAALLLATGLTGCGEQEAEKHATQTAANVNGAEITVHQVNYLLRQSGDKAREPAAPRQALDALVDQELLLQKAMENKLDRDPDVMQSLENARRQVLTQAYVQRMVAPHSPIAEKIAEKDIKDFFEKTPGLFKNRRIYQLQLFAVNKQKMNDALNAELDQAHTPDQVRKILKKHAIAAQEETTARAAEQLPMEMLDTFGKAKIGDIIVAPQGAEQIVLMQVINVAEKPVALEQAKPQIEVFLQNARDKKALEEHVKQLRSLAKINYAGEFAAVPPSVKLPEPREQAPVAAPVTTPEPAAERKHLEKGLSGLK
jgi:EpsD family peptidyl-prolyl cis-trans isomerase